MGQVVQNLKQVLARKKSCTLQHCNNLTIGWEYHGGHTLGSPELLPKNIDNVSWKFTVLYLVRVRTFGVITKNSMFLHIFRYHAIVMLLLCCKVECNLKNNKKKSISSC